MTPQPNQGVRLGAALFNGDHGRLADEVARLEAAGLDLIHMDVFDGHFVSDLGFPPRTLAALRPLTQLPFEVHLGAVDPLRFVPHLADAGTDLLIFHLESVPMLYEAIFAVREHKLNVGLAVTMGTALTNLEPVIPLIDAVLLLSRVTGEGSRGASFDVRVLPRVQRVREMVQAAGAAVDIQVAGGVKREHVAQLVQAGATTLAMGGGIYRVPDMVLEVAEMRALAKTTAAND
jgi:ribulose-phosphate 3-epimerase